MDIEEYLKQKRELEAKKELLEAKDRLKQEKDKKKPDERRHEEKKISVDKGPTPEPSIADLFRKMVFWNIFILIIIVVLFGAFYLFPREVQVVESGNNGQDISATTQSTSNQNGSATDEQTSTYTNQSNTTSEQEKYPGPEFSLSVEDRDLGPFDERGRIGGETLIITSKYYDDAVIFLQSGEPNRIACFVDRQITVDSDMDGEADIKDFDLDFTKVELNPEEKFQWQDSLPGAFEEGEYTGGKVTVEYEARCYYCKDKFCDAIDTNGESTATALLKFTVNEDYSNDGNSTS